MRSIIISLLILSITLPLSGRAQDGGELFRKNCTACHKLGAKLVGPDLTGITEKRSAEWLHKFITSSQTMVTSGDADAVKVYEENNKMVMPDQMLSIAEIDLILSFIKESGAPATATSDAAAPAATEKPVEYTDADRDMGRQFFDGSVRLSAGGPACISCHNVTGNDVMLGGALAKDLTQAFSRMGHAGITGILSAPPFPAMATSYSAAPLTDQEMHQLAAFLAKADAESAQAIATPAWRPFFTYGLGGLVVLLCLFALLWKDRLRKTVKADIYDRQIKSI